MKHLLIVILLWSSPAEATKVGINIQPCPLGEGKVKVYEQIAANTFGGFDSDLASYSSNGQFREYAISTCKDNLLSLYGTDMLAPWSESEKKKLAATLTAASAALPSDWEGSVSDRYILAAEIYRAMGKDSLFLANLYLQASWVARDSAVGIFLGLEGPVQARALLTEGSAALKTPLGPDKKKVLLHNLVRIAHRGGYVEERDTYLKAFTALPLTPSEREIPTQMQKAFSQEARLQDLAIKSFTQGLSLEGLDMQGKIRSTYLLGDLLRRRGHYRDSFVLFALVIGEETAPQDLRSMALVLSDEMAETWPDLFATP